MVEKNLTKKDPADLGKVHSTAAELQLYANGAQITSQEKLEEANDFLQRIKNGKKFLDGWKETFVLPIKMKLKQLEAPAKIVEDMLKGSEFLLKTKILDYKKKVDDDIAKKTAKIEQQVESGEKTFEQGSTAMQRQEEKKENFRTMSYDVVEITDINLIPVEYMEPLLPKIKMALKSGTVVPGAKLIKKETVVTR